MGTHSGVAGTGILHDAGGGSGGVTFDELHRTDFTDVVGLVYALSGSRHAAEELAQDAFLAAHRNWDRVGSYDGDEWQALVDGAG